MKSLAHWLQTHIEARGLTQSAVSVHAGVSVATTSQMLNQDHIPRIETLFRLADYFGASREKVLRIAAHMPMGEKGPQDEDDYLVEELVAEFRKVPDEWKEEAVRQMQMSAPDRTPAGPLRAGGGGG